MIEVLENQKEYELLDSGENEKLERFGSVIISRPDPEALWPKMLSSKEWQKADAIFVREGNKGKWKIKNDKLPEPWTITLHDLVFNLKPTSFKHVGIFPEQVSNWKWLEKNIKRGAKMLNLFGYTGGATLVALRAGIEVTHVDGSKTAVAWARENAELNNLAALPCRWIVDDAREYLKREIKRGMKYDVIIMDPPSFGHGPKDEPWKIEENFLELMELTKQVLSDSPQAVLINGYTAGYSGITFANNLLFLKEKFGGTIEHGELALKESTSARLLPAGIFARWSK